jgi:diaminopimelate decarboxylase
MRSPSDRDMPPQHAAMNQFAVRGNCLEIGGRSLLEVSAEMGEKPFYAYDLNVVDAQLAALRSALPREIRLHYAVKANPMPQLVRHLAKSTDGLDVASGGELQLVLASGASPEAISFAGPGKQRDELAAAVMAGVTLNIESEGEMHRLATLGQALGKRPRVAVRINPDFELKTSGMKMSGGAKPFGVDAEKVPALLHKLAALPLDFHGFHIFCGSQSLRPEAIITAQTSTFELAFRLAKECPMPIATLNIGGGFGVPYFPGEKRLPLAGISNNLRDCIKRAKTQLPGTEIAMELGRFLVAEAGIYVCQIVDKKESRGEVFLVTNGGLNHHLAASGNFGQVIRKNYPVCIGNRLNDDTLQQVSIVGPLCTPLDILAEKVSLPRADIGDLVVVYQSGAYGYSSSPHGFLGHPPPKQCILP